MDRRRWGDRAIGRSERAAEIDAHVSSRESTVGTGHRRTSQDGEVLRRTQGYLAPCGAGAVKQRRERDHDGESAHKADQCRGSNPETWTWRAFHELDHRLPPSI